MRRFTELTALRQECADLRQALVDRKVLEQAKQLLVKRDGIEEKDAFQRLQDLAAATNQKLIEVAQTVLATRSA